MDTRPLITVNHQKYLAIRLHLIRGLSSESIRSRTGMPKDQVSRFLSKPTYKLYLEYGKLKNKFLGKETL